MGGEFGGEALHRSSPCVFSTVYTKFHLDRERLFLELPYEFSVKI